MAEDVQEVPVRTVFNLEIETADGRTLRISERAPISHDNDSDGAMALLTKWAKEQLGTP